jgi:hypothetical protein
MRVDIPTNYFRANLSNFPACHPCIISLSSPMRNVGTAVGLSPFCEQ